LQEDYAMLQQTYTTIEHVVNERLTNGVSYNPYNPYHQSDKINKSREEKTLEPKIEGYSTSLSLDMNILCIQ